MTSQSTVATPFAISQGQTTLSPNAPEFVTSLTRARTNSQLQAKDSVSSMTENQNEDSKSRDGVGADGPTARTASMNGASAEASAPASAATSASPSPDSSRPQGGLPGPISLSKANSTTQSGAAPVAAAQASGVQAAGAQQPPSQAPNRVDSASARPPSARQGRSTSFPGPSDPSQLRRNKQAGARPPQPNAYSDPHYGGQQLLMPPAAQAPFYPSLPYGQMYPLPMNPSQPDNHNPAPVLYPPGPQYMMQWPYQMVPMVHDHYPNRGFPQAVGLPPQSLQGSFYNHEYEDPYLPQSGGEPHWHPQAGVANGHAAFYRGRSQSLGNAGAGWSSEDLGQNRQDWLHFRAPSMGGGPAAQPPVPTVESILGVPEGEAPSHRRQASTSSSERKKGHRRMVSVPIDFQAATAEPAERTSLESPVQSPAEKLSRPKRKGHRRQTSLPTASDMERLREGGRRGRHSRSSSWVSSGRTSAVLEEYKATREGDRKWTLSDVKGHVVEFCKDQTGSRFIQQALDDPETSSDQVRDVAQEAKPRFAVLMEDVFGNYVIQKLLERASTSEKAWMAERICKDAQKPHQSNRAVALSKHQYGCRVVQKALETLELEDKKAIMQQLLESTLDLVADQNGNHVIQKCIECIKPTSHIEPLVNELLSGKESRTIPTLRGEVVPLSQHTYGCRVVQRILEHCDDRRFKERFMVEILKDVLALSKNIYSNYVIQHVLGFGTPQEKDTVLRDLLPHVVALSRDKFASNVVERCLKHGTAEQRRQILLEFLRSEHAFVQMMKDDYGNYVCYSAFEIAEEGQKQQLVEVIKKSMSSVRRTSFGKNFHSRLVENHPDYFEGSDFGIHNNVKGQPARQQQSRQRGSSWRQQSRGSTPTIHEANPAAALQSLVAQVAQVPGPAVRAEPRRTVDAGVPPSKTDDAVKFTAGQVSVMADGANPPVRPPVPMAAERPPATGNQGTEQAGALQIEG